MRKFKNASLPIHLSDNVYISPDGEFALYQTCALKYLKWCLNLKITVLGFDVWLPSKPYPTVITSVCFTGTATECINTIKKS